MAVLAALCCASLRASSDSYLFMWAGDAGHKASDFLAVIDASPTSAGYGRIVTSIPTGEAGTHPHHTEHQMPASGHLLANVRTRRCQPQKFWFRRINSGRLRT